MSESVEMTAGLAVDVAGDPAVEVLQVAAWSGLPWLRHGFTARRGGVSSVYGGKDLNLGLTAADDRERVLENRSLAVAAVAPGARLETLRQVHGTRVIVAGRRTEPEEADGMVSAEPGIALGILVADCVPVLLMDRRTRAVAALHAGWRGTVAGIAGQGVTCLREEFGSVAENLAAAIGPSIGPCCYAVGEELIVRVGWESGLLERRDGSVYFDLWEANRRQLQAAGVSDVSVLGLCTSCATSAGRRRFFSHRAEAGRTGRAMGLIAVLPD